MVNCALTTSRIRHGSPARFDSQLYDSSFQESGGWRESGVAGNDARSIDGRGRVDASDVGVIEDVVCFQEEFGTEPLPKLKESAAVASVDLINAGSAEGIAANVQGPIDTGARETVAIENPVGDQVLLVARREVREDCELISTGDRAQNTILDAWELRLVHGGECKGLWAIDGRVASITLAICGIFNEIRALIISIAFWRIADRVGPSVRAIDGDTPLETPLIADDERIVRTVRADVFERNVIELWIEARGGVGRGGEDGAAIGEKASGIDEI